jgi:Domain of unknown function (DUF4124)
MFNLKLLSANIILMMLFSASAEAKLYKWVDDNGTTHYGEVVPPEYANKDRDSLKKSGLLEKRPEKIDPDAIRAKEQAEAKRKTDNQAAEEQKRRDNALMNTYSNEKEIDLARDRSLVLINARIESNVMLLKSSQANLDEHKKEFDSRTKTGKKIPQSLSNDIAQAEERVSRLQVELRKNEDELAAVKTRFDNEKELYRRIKGGSGKK